MDNSSNDVRRPPLKESDLYRPRLGSRNVSLSKAAMVELRGWRDASEPPASLQRLDPDAGGQA